MYNRAAKDEGREQWTDEDLLYPFVDAFPEPVSRELRGSIDRALVSGNPYRDLSSRAPQKVAGDRVTLIENKRKAGDLTIATVYNAVQKLSTDVSSMKKRAKLEGSCSGCG